MTAMIRLCCALLLGMGLLTPCLAASAKDKPAAGASLSKDKKLSLYAEPVAFMTFCDMKMNDDAFAATIKAAGISAASTASVKGRADKLVEALRAENDTNDKKIAFCKMARTIPVIKSWTAASE
jgi:hypothetical protein